MAYPISLSILGGTTIDLCEHSNSLCKINNWLFRHYCWWYCCYYYCLFLYCTLAPAIEKSDYEPKAPEANASVDADTVNDATAFLETFFKIYPTATEKELAYYVSGNVIEPIGRDYLYSELINSIFTKDGDNVKVKVAVKFLDNQTKATQVSQYELVLHKDSNWKIVG